MEVEAFPIRFTRGVRAHWRRRKYQRLDSASGAGGTRSHATKRLGGGGGGNGGARWGVRLRTLLRRVRVVRAAPGRLLRRVRDAYVGGMLGVARRASAMALPSAGEALCAKRVPRRKQLALPSAGGPSEFEKRLVMEIYKSIVASKELTTMLHSSTAHLPAAHTPPSASA
ncbi:uncharacterized protein LOC100830726 [Brachypodium distachyon]|uniref:Uncharacterized protein n=1 Tax=Brachypodium distachyon TaxID=15368 RepID=I1HG53_BRADI|nr:uncharacterized protein LOC100830726 [Brachypodium distachyon]KQK04741.1 hypothetical protein BRADI_2g15650v3 [Brachypodium distachyon]|eukprot:XP_003567840.1 uncharacterized protein LOC100830726 [Brachypodium distachyon]